LAVGGSLPWKFASSARWTSSSTRTLPVAGPSERCLLAALACSAGRVVAVERLIDDLWGEDLPANPTNALQVRVSKLRRQLGGRISTERAGYALEVDPDDVDVLRFARLVAGRRFEEALALYRGPPLAEFRDHEWARAGGHPARGVASRGGRGAGGEPPARRR
jgi:DNA-binding SARP family transcriptional activator